MTEEFPERTASNWWRYLVSAIGGLLLVVLCLLLIAAGIRIALDMTDGEDAVRVLVWMSGGVLALAALGAWFQFVVPTTDTAFQTLLVFLSALAAGALFGAVVGYYDVRVRSLVDRASRERGRREFLDEQQEALSALDGTLRHQVLNDTSAISGRAQLLEAGKIDPETAVESILEHCDHMTDTVDRIGTVVDVLTWVTDTGETDVNLAIERAIATVEDDRPDAPIEVTGDTETTVLADALLYLALYELLDNAFWHGKPPVTVSVEERTDSVAVTVTDTGTTVGVSPRQSLFEPNTRGTDSDGDGLGLYLADLIVDRYDGEIRLRSGSQTAFEIEVPQG